MTARIVLLVTSPRLPAGLLTAQAWDLVRAYPVLAGAENAQTTALRANGADVTILPSPTAAALLAAAGTSVEDGGTSVEDGGTSVQGGGTSVEDGGTSVEDGGTSVEGGGTVVWLAGPDGDQRLARELGLKLASNPELAEMELLYGSWDPPGARLLDAVAVMDRLHADDAWKRSQTHQTLARYLLEEAYEAYDAIRADDLDALRGEIGDVLLQVLLHARMAEELPDEERWTIDDVAGEFVEKMIRRNPHVFEPGRETDDLEEIVANWNAVKAAERAAHPPRATTSLASALATLAQSSRDEDAVDALREALRQLTS
ncbi:XTP/dITP diphosphohydrolase [Hamadaea flava]|uniref:MazG nucleotide pyrophosphohydrolase domain-containing protein n=1 Tax=Hamadaea flava TaxID=1742688 RepID=A0ABV8LHQ7_9ACTN|nr:MazG nucleotide pyrophosphohydrolase domain-containing protein [Hamadaea flava]MCP2326599.1 XTP/dITP diphosphohydrolase [Hamadaea flava]